MNLFLLVIFANFWLINSFNIVESNIKRKTNEKRFLKCFSFEHCIHGIELGLLTVGTGLIMDNKISKSSVEKLKENNITLYNRGMLKSYKNLLFLGPIYYGFISSTMDQSYNINLINTFEIVFIHSIGYYLAHRNMHRNDLFKNYHYFHHQFNETLVPSIGNAVSEMEFTIAYMLPFVVGSIIVNPNIASFDLGIMIVSIMNLIIHCQELENVEWNKYFVSPRTHLYHHQSKNLESTYSAPTFNLEYLIKVIRSRFE